MARFGRSFGEGEQEDGRPRILLWGPSGTGKTTAAVRAAADLHLDLDEEDASPAGDRGIFLLATEANSLAAARAANPLVRWELVQADAARPDAAVRLLGEILDFAASGEMGDDGVHTLVVDGLTEASALLRDHLSAGSGGRMSLEDWGVLADRIRRLVRRLRALPLRVVCTALDDLRAFGPEGHEVTVAAPALDGKSGAKVAQFFSAVGRTERWAEVGRDGAAVDRYGATFVPPADGGPTTVKRAGRLRGRVLPCAAAWIEVIEGTRPWRDVALRPPTADVARDAASDEGSSDAGRRGRALRR